MKDRMKDLTFDEFSRIEKDTVMYLNSMLDAAIDVSKIEKELGDLQSQISSEETVDALVKVLKYMLVKKDFKALLKKKKIVKPYDLYYVKD